LSVRRRDAAGEAWLPVLDALNLRFVAECAEPQHWERINALLAMAEQAPIATPVGGERAAREMAAEEEAWQRRLDEMRREQEQAQARPPAPKPRWGTKEARRLEEERIRREIAEKAAKRAGDPDDAV
jgi:hypothetical protein